MNNKDKNCLLKFLFGLLKTVTSCFVAYFILVLISKYSQNKNPKDDDTIKKNRKTLIKNSSFLND